MAARTKTTFTVVYSGPGLDDHLIDARDLAGALMAIGDFCDAACKQQFGQGSTAKILVNALQPGSFQIDLQLWLSVKQQILNLLNTPEVQAVATVSSIIGVCNFLKFLKGKQPKKATQFDDKTTVVNYNGDKQVIHNNTYNFYNHPPTRDALQGLVRPLRKEGIDALTLQSLQNGRRLVAEITEGDFPYFVPNKSKIEESERTLIVSIVNLSFAEQYKWRVSDGETTYSVSLKDGEFREAIEAGRRRFSVDDQLRISMRTTQWQEGGKLKASHQILHVLEHKTPSQGDLPSPTAASKEKGS